MVGARAARLATNAKPTMRLYERIGEFLFDQRLEPNPTNYAFAYHLLADNDGPLARAVAKLTEGGVRLTQRDIESLGCQLPEQAGRENVAKEQERAQGLVARTQMQVEGFEDMVHAMRAETEGFGRDLAASAAAIGKRRGDAAPDALLLEEVAHITGSMLERVRTAESRLEAVTREASDLRQKLEEARDNARRDPLTELPNRRAFEEAFARHAATGERMCVAVCDVDHFKSVNDRFGHAVGDRVLKAIAEALTDSCRGQLVARYGGEEFAVLFTGVKAEAARDTLDAARARVAAKRYRVRDTDQPLGEVTFSAGITLARAGESYGGVFQRADELLYAAKTDGRNCVRAG